jgi:SAM-dependent methyltransferase
MNRQLEVLRLFRHASADPIGFNERVARMTVDDLARDLRGVRVLDLACGPGHYTRALRELGATVVPVDVKVVTVEHGPPDGLVVSDATKLAIADDCMDGILCSNLIEHTRTPRAVIDEMQRVVRPGGWIWLSWTNWFSPYGGHDMSPWHYLGPKLGLKAYRRLKGVDPVCAPGKNLYPLHIGATLRDLHSRPGLEVLDVVPRYYPSQRWILKVPGLREVATWNCLVTLERAS